MKTFYLTFGQKYPWRKGWVEVRADNEAEARLKVIQIFDRHWSMLYPEENFKDKEIFFPAGKLGETIV